MTARKPHLPPVIDEGIDPRLCAVLRDAPAGVHVIFAGPDETFLNALRRIYGVPLPCPDVLVCTRGSHLVISVAARNDADGLLVNLKPKNDGETYYVQPIIVFTPNRTSGAAKRLAEQDSDHANLLIGALEDLLFRRVLPAERVS